MVVETRDSLFPEGSSTRRREREREEIHSSSHQGLFCMGDPWEMGCFGNNAGIIMVQDLFSSSSLR